MKSRYFPPLLAVAVAAAQILVSGCGGGGGGGGGAGAGNLNYRPSSGVRLVHAAIDLAPAVLSTSADTSAALSSARFAVASPYVSLTRTQQTLSVASPGAQAFSQVVSPQQDLRHTVLVYGDRESLGIRYALIEDYPGKPASSASWVRIVHAMTGASSIDASFSLAGSSHNLSASFGQASGYIEIEPGTWSVNIRRHADSALAFSEARVFEAGKAYSLVVAGEQGYFVTGLQLTD